MHGDGADGIVDSQPLQQFHAEDNDDASNAPEQDRASRADPVAGTGDGDQPCEEAVDGEADIPLLAHEVGGEHGGETCGACSQRGVGRDATDADEVHGGERRAGIESIPAKPEQQAARCRDREIVGQHRAAAVAFELAPQAWPQDDGSGQRYHAADGVDHGRAGKVMEALTEVGEEVACGAHGCQESVRPPCPVANDGIDEARHADRVEQVADEAGAPDHGAGGNGGAGVRERELEDPEGKEGDARCLIGCGCPLQEEPVVTDEAVAMAEHEGEADGIEE